MKCNEPGCKMAALHIHWHDELLITETPKGRKIHKFDFREGYEPIEASVPKPQCYGCGIETPHELHYGVYFNTVAYMVFHSAECAFAHGDDV